MSKTAHTPETPATRALKAAKIAFQGHLYAYEEHGGTQVSARELGVDEHLVIKTLIMEDETRQPLVILMHGDCTVSTKELARQTGHKQISPCAIDTAQRHSGYLVGGTSPFGLRKAMPVFYEASIATLATIYINGGRRGFLVSLAPEGALKLLEANAVNVALHAGT